jgi:hypothetical protein
MTRLARFFSLRLFAIALLLSVRPLTTAIGVILANNATSQPHATERNLLPDASKALIIGRPLAWLTHHANHSLHIATDSFRSWIFCGLIGSSGTELTFSAHPGFRYFSGSRAPPR